MHFQQNANAFNRLRIYKGSGCWSYVGKQYSWASQDVSIGDGCDSLGTVCHEIAHALGFYHTQSRSDRDNYININYANVQGSLQYNFQKLTPATEKHYGMAYDYGSVMQYNPYAFAINYNIPTSVARDINYQNMMGQREGPAFSDVKQMNLLYNCADRCQSKPACQNNGIVNSKTCTTCICPRGFDGPTCDALKQGSGSACNGQILQATSSYDSFTMTVGNGMTYKFSSTPSDCYWQIKAPAGQRIQFQIKSLDTNCMEGCNWAGFEVNTGNLDLAGMLVCCSSISNSAFTSVGNVITVRGTARYNNGNMVISFRAV
ncbi:astacin [Ancylostoma caninum]|uniref:Metalloendopeptidase n=1 Tax=Ancylostoma caninum TaxID=29170 RepID=A0A368FSH3_ANCCA|nr:astacin [Ancylostoma caninum]